MRAWLTPAAHDLTDLTCRTVKIPNAPDWLALVTGALAMLADASNFEQVDGVSPDTVADYFIAEMLDYLDTTGACMIGSILPFATTDLPAGYLPCDGGTYAKADYPRLYAKLDTVYIIDADYFMTPDLGGVVILGTGNGYDLGDTGGAETHTLTTAEMPAHTHTTQPHTHSVVGVATLDLLGELPGAGMAPTPSTTGAAGVTVDSTGGGGAHNNMQPYHALQYGIRAV